MNIVPLTVGHLRGIRLQPKQRYPLEEEQNWLRSDPGYAVVEGNTVYACCGFIPAGPRFYDPCIMWSLLSVEAKARMLRLTRIGNRMVVARGGEVWTHVTYGFEEAHRWMGMLGFQHYKLLDSGDSVYRRFA